MKLGKRPPRIVPLVILIAMVLPMVTSRAQPSADMVNTSFTAQDFRSIAPQGFGDRQNSYAWSMAWFKGKLYVGTGRATQCVQMATLSLFYPFLHYPPLDPDVECTPDKTDLPLQAEIWRWTPETGTWERIYQSPNDVPIPGVAGKFVARDIGYRDMLVFTEPDGTEALYVSGVSARSMYPGIAPPRILRSIDGVTFNPLPQDPGTFLGSTKANGFRDLAAFKGRLYIVASLGYLGHGPVYEATHPAGGNNNFQQITPDGMTQYEMAEYNNHLYLGGAAKEQGYTVWKTDASGPLPYTFTPVISDGAYMPRNPSLSIVSMYVFHNRLYIGTDRPAEIVRINPDDTWDLIVGTPRDTPVGRKEPLSGMSVGFDWHFNFHIWRMQQHDGVLYVGTFDQTTHWNPIPILGRLLEPQMGFDFYSTTDGIHYTPITVKGFDQKFDVGVRSFASTSHGLFVGIVNVSYGLKILRAGSSRWDVYLPAVGSTSGRASSSTGSRATANSGATTNVARPPLILQAERKRGKIVLSWDAPPAATRYRIFRSTYVFHSAESVITSEMSMLDGASLPITATLDMPTLISDEELGFWEPGPFTEIGTTQQPFFVDRTIKPGPIYQYYVVAENNQATYTQRSTLVRTPVLVTAPSIADLRTTLDEWSQHSQVTHHGVKTVVLPALADMQALLQDGQLGDAAARLQRLQETLTDNSGVLEPWRTVDLQLLLAQLRRRIELARQGILAPTDLLQPPTGTP